MDMLILLLIGISLSMDCFAIAVCISSRHKLQVVETIRVASHFAIIQAGMLMVGAIAGSIILSQISAVDHWIAFSLLAWIGLKMVREPHTHNNTDLRSESSLIMLAIATSIDALIVGITIGTDIIFSGLIVGISTLVITLAGVTAGRKLHTLHAEKATIIGGLVLIGLGFKTLLSHVL